MPVRFAIAAAVGLAFSALAQTAQDELERQLKEMVGKPPTKLKVEFEGLDQPNYKLVELSFDLDGSALPVSNLEQLNGEGKHLIFHGDIKPGRHTLESTAVLTDVSGALFSYEAGFKWKVKNTRSFELQPGLEVEVVLSPELTPGEKDPKKKFALKSTAVPKMLAKLEDGTMPDSPKPNLPPPLKEEVDAGQPAVAELTPAQKAKNAADEAKRKKQEAADEAKRKKDEAAAARAAAAEEKKRKREEALAAKKTAAEDAKRQKAEAAAAKKAAADEAKRQKAEAAAAKTGTAPSEAVAAKEPGAAKAAPETPQPSEVVAAPPTSDVAAATADAGAPAVAAAEPPKPAAPTPQSPEKPAEASSGLPLPVLIGVGVALLGVIIFFATRKKSS
ncbi:MAG: hypothetical protein IPJ65_12885 [Archangiaceae bacterium]|nr:hypothetical protein [Archangiaceae bacterium]